MFVLHCRADTICDARPLFPITNVLPRCNVTFFQQRDVFAGWERDILTIWGVAWLLAN